MLNVNSGDNGFHRWNQGQFFEMVLKVYLCIYTHVHWKPYCNSESIYCVHF